MRTSDPSKTLIRLRVRAWTLELHDGQEQQAPNVSRAYGIWRRSGMTSAEFVRIMHVARDRARFSQRIDTRAAGLPGELGLRNRMPYFFAVLETLAIEGRIP